jgi:protein-disulfide isomerase
MLDNVKLAALEKCFAAQETLGRIDFQVEVTGTDTKRTITSAKPLPGDRENTGLYDRALETCAMDVLKGAPIEVAADFPESQRVTVLTGASMKRLGETPETATHVDEGSLAGLPTLGPPNAPVTLVEYNDFQCIFCARLAHTVEELTQRYPTQLRVVFRNSPLPMHGNAGEAARAAIAAHLQGHFWQMHDMLYLHQQELDRSSLFEYARRIGLDMERFEADLRGKEVADHLQRDLDSHKRLRSPGTPIMTINGAVIVGARPADEIAKAIDDALTGAANDP